MVKNPRFQPLKRVFLPASYAWKVRLLPYQCQLECSCGSTGQHVYLIDPSCASLPPPLASSTI